MKTTLSTQAYRWREDLGDGSTREHVGRFVQVPEYDYEGGEPAFVSAVTGLLTECDLTPSIPVLVQHFNTRELEFVEFGKLSPYPSEPIPEPSAEVQVNQ